MMRKIGANSAAPPIPLSIAVVATHIETGNMNQYRVQSRSARNSIRLHLILRNIDRRLTGRAS